MATDFWLGVTQTAIGSTLGFVLGIFAFRYQQKQQSDKKSKDEYKAAIDVLNRVTTAAGANIEALANSKLQLIYDLRPEVEKMQDAAKIVYETSGSERTNRVAELVNLSNSMQHFYMTLPETSIMSAPDFKEFSLLSKEMPALSLFVHRALGMMQELNTLTNTRNILIAQQAMENSNGKGISSDRIIYYASMLSGQGRAICEHTDFALNFWRLVLDQIKYYKSKKAPDEHILEYSLVPEALNAMPKEELFPLMREQIATFSDKGKA